MSEMEHFPDSLDAEQLLAHLDVEELPATLRELVDLIGLSATLTLARHWGGLSLYVPQRVGDTHPLAERLGLEAARKLADYYRGDEIMVPSGYAALARARQRAIQTEHAAGKSARELAKKHRLSERRVWYILEASRKDWPELQSALF